jgi:hypothetical protein
MRRILLIIMSLIEADFFKYFMIFSQGSSSTQGSDYYLESPVLYVLQSLSCKVRSFMQSMERYKFFGSPLRKYFSIPYDSEAHAFKDTIDVLNWTGKTIDMEMIDPYTYHLTFIHFLFHHEEDKGIQPSLVKLGAEYLASPKLSLIVKGERKGHI